MKRYIFRTIIPVLLIFTGCASKLILLSPDDLFALGDYYLEDGKYTKAGEQYERIRNSYPNSPYATMSQYKLAKTKLLEGKYDEAAVEFELFVEFHPAHKKAPSAYYKMAMCKYKSLLTPDRDITMGKEALAAFDQFLKLYPDHPDAEKAREYRSLTFDHIMRHDLEAGLVYYRRQAYKAAINRIQPVFEKANSVVLRERAGYFLGRSLTYRGKYADARKVFEQVIALDIPSKYLDKSRKRLAKLPEITESTASPPEQSPTPHQP